MNADLESEMAERIDTLTREAVEDTVRGCQAFREPDVEARLGAELSRRGVLFFDESWLAETAAKIRQSQSVPA